MKEEKIIEMNEAAVDEVEEIKETKLDKIKNSKLVTFGKKHGKKLAVGAAIGAAFLIGRALGANDDDEEFRYDDNEADDNVIDIHDYSVSEETSDAE